MRRCIVLILAVLSGFNLWSQDTDAVITTDTTVQILPERRPLVQKRPRIQRDTTQTADTILNADSSILKDSAYVVIKVQGPTISLFKVQPHTSFLLISPFFRFTDPMRYSITIKKWQGKEAIFYSVIVLLLFFALIKNSFGRYLEDLFKTYFRTTVKQKQTKEQLLQNPLPSILLNLFFVFSIGMFLALLLQYFQMGLDINFWLLYLYCVLALITIYAVKFVSLKFFGWVFQVSDATNGYIFIVFTTNKIIGIALLPILIVLAFTEGMVNEAAVSLGIMLVFALLTYRFFLSYLSIHKQIRIGFFHFFLYLSAFEVVPLLLINKLLFSFLGETP